MEESLGTGTKYNAPVVSGVHQGTVLGPLLNLIFINDLPLNIQSNVRLFADDCIVYREINSLNDCDLFHQDIHRLEEWENPWSVEFHPARCNVMSGTNSRRPFKAPYTLKGHQLTVEATSKYLGVDLTSNLDWKAHVDRIIKTSNRVLGFLRRNLRLSNEQTKINAYIEMVRSNLE